MYLVTYVVKNDDKARLGVLVGAPKTGGRFHGVPGEVSEGWVLDLVRYARGMGVTLPAGMKALLLQKKMTAAKKVLAQFYRDCRSGKPAKLNRFLSPVQGVRWLPPVPDPRKIILVGKNYRDHCKEGSAGVPAKPVIFSKFITSLNCAGGRIVLPKASSKVDYEAELAVVIGRGGRHIPEAAALRHVAGYMPLNDVSARDMQFSEGQWVRAKSCDTFCPCGPALATTDHVKDPQSLRIRLALNGRIMQEASTCDMIFPVKRLIAFVSEAITLEPGDIISTGTPSGVGAFRDPPAFLKAGDRVSVVIEKVGVLTNRVVDEKGRRIRTKQGRMKKAFD